MAGSQTLLKQVWTVKGDAHRGSEGIIYHNSSYTPLTRDTNCLNPFTNGWV